MRGRISREAGSDVLLITLNSHRCLFHICCPSIQLGTGKSTKRFHLHSYKGQIREVSVTSLNYDIKECPSVYYEKFFNSQHVPRSSVPAVKTGRWHTFIHVGFTAEPCEASGTQAEESIGPVHTFPAILARVGHALVDVDVALRP